METKMELTTGNMELGDRKEEKKPVGGEKRRQDIQRYLDHASVVKVFTVLEK